MNAESKTSPSRSESREASKGTALRKRRLSYVPGQKTSKPRRVPRTAQWQELADETMHQILQLLLDGRKGLSIILLSMVNRQLRKQVQADVQIWYGLYLHWRGPIGRPRTYGTNRGTVSLRPTYPISLPNFRIKSPPISCGLPPLLFPTEPQKN